VTRSTSRLLVLDAGGVILTNQMPQLYQDLAHAAVGTHADVEAAYLPLRVDLWAGALDEYQFWRLLLDDPGIATPIKWRQDRVAELIQPLLPVDTLRAWATMAPVWVLSNHRSEWLLPALDRYGYAKYLSRVVVSDTAGLVKPDAACYRYLVESHVGPAGDILFVDDKARNLAPAKEHGVATLEADPDGSWAEQCSSWLQV